MAKKEQEIKVTVICWNCDKKFSLLATEIEQKCKVYLGEEEERLGASLVSLRTYLVPCPKCGSENKVKLP